MDAKNVKEVELEFSRKLDNALADILQDLGYSLPRSHQVKASLLDSEELNSQISKTAAKESPAKAEKLSKGIPGLLPAEADLLIALDRAEARPGWNFVPLKKFRDEILPQEHLPSLANTDVHHRSVLESVINKKFVLVGKVPNPKSPQFPVTTIRLNRLMSEVKAVLGQNGSSDLDFHPVEISGEPLSATILRERR